VMRGREKKLRRRGLMPMAEFDKGFNATKHRTQFLMGRLLLSRAECRATSAHRRTTAHFTVGRTGLHSGYVVNKTVSCVLMNVILVSMI
jgi:hypothetical protein